MLRSSAWTIGLVVCISSCRSDRPEFKNFDNRPADAGESTTSSGSEDPTLTDEGSDAIAPGAVNPTEPGQNSEPTDEDASDDLTDGSNTDSEPTDDSGPEGDCKPGSVRPCAAGGALGNCAGGEQLCQEDAKWGACSVEPQQADDCTKPGDDADCDGTPNSGCDCTDGDEQACGPTQTIGRCEPGKSVCADGAYRACEGAVEAIARDCSSTEDNDCDGVADDTLDGVCQCKPGDVRACDQHPGLDGKGQCQAGSQTCVAAEDGSSSAWSECTGAVGPELQDSCDGVDDSNCNGIPNEGCSCTSDADCDDSVACTEDACEDGACKNTVASGFCRIDGQCVEHNMQDSSNPCRYCDATLNQTAWSNSAPGTSCDDGVWCNGTDSCNGAGACSQHQFATNRCAEQSGPCVLDTCDEANKTCFRGTNFVCDQGKTEKECVSAPNTCGSDVRSFSEQRHCDGKSAQCLGEYKTVYGSTQDCGAGYCDGSNFTCKQLGCGDTWCNDGLCWTLDEPATMNLEDATAYCDGLGRHGAKWRLPSINEWLEVSRGCNNGTGYAVNDVNFASTCRTVPCENSCPLLEGPNPYDCYWPTEFGDCHGIAGNYSAGRYWSSSNRLWSSVAGADAVMLSSLESLYVRCLTPESGP